MNMTREEAERLHSELNRQYHRLQNQQEVAAGVIGRLQEMNEELAGRAEGDARVAAQIEDNLRSIDKLRRDIERREREMEAIRDEAREMELWEWPDFGVLFTPLVWVWP